MRSILVISSLVIVAACSKKNYPMQETEINRLDVEYKDTLIRIPANSILINKTVPTDCPDFDTTVRKDKQTVTVKKKGNNLSVECKQDSLEMVIRGLLEKRTSSKTVTIPVPVKVPDPYIPKIVWWLIGILAATSVWGNRKLIGRLIKIATGWIG